MAQEKHPILSLSDESVIRSLAQIYDELSETEKETFQDGEIILHTDKFEDVLLLDDLYRKNKSHVLNTYIEKYCMGDSKIYHTIKLHGIKNANNKASVVTCVRNIPESSNGLYNNIIIENLMQGGEVTNEFFRNRILVALKHFKQFTINSSAQLLTPEFQHHYQVREESIVRLESLIEEQFRNLRNRQDELEEDFKQKKLKLEEENAQIKDINNQQFQEKLTNLEDREGLIKSDLEKIEDRLKEYNRKSQLAQMFKDIDTWNDAFKLSDQTNKLRLPVNLTALSMMFFFGASAVAAFIQYIFRQDSAISISQISQIAGFTLGFTFSSIFFIRFSNQWFQRNANEEFRLKRLKLDMNRANWFAEYVSEWNIEHENELIPEDIVEPLTRNLFLEIDSHNPAEHPIDTLKNSFFKMKSSPHGAEVQVGHEGRRKFRKQNPDPP